MGTLCKRRERAAGFTLIELMIVVAIIAILAAIALPIYSNYITRSKLTEAQNWLSQLRVSMEQYYQDNRSYAGSASGTTTSCGVSMPTSPTVKYFTFTCALNGTTGYTITATGNAGTQTANFTYTIDNSNNRGTTSVNSDWYAVPQTNCWVTNKGVCQ